MARARKGAFSHALEAYFKNIRLILFFSIPSLLAFLIPLLSPLPSYNALGAIFLRTGSIPELTFVDVAVIIVSFLLSLFLLSFAVVAINIVIRAQRTLTHIKKEIIEGIDKYVFSLFWLFLVATLLTLVVNILAFEYGFQSTLYPLATFIISLFFVFAPPALIIDDYRPLRALQMSLKTVREKPLLFAGWLLTGLVAVSVIEAFALSIAPSGTAELIVLVLNSFIVLPFLVVLQTQIYLTKYGLLR